MLKIMYRLLKSCMNFKTIKPNIILTDFIILCNKFKIKWYKVLAYITFKK